MGSPFVGEIRLVGFNFEPVGWSFCNGALLAISQNPALFDLIGTTYGGDGQSTFQLPNLQSRVAIHQGQGPGLSPYVIGQTGGAEAVTLTANQIPAHNHLLMAAADGTTATPGPSVTLGTPVSLNMVYAAQGSLTPTQLSNASIGPAGGSQPHSNIKPYLSLNYIISLFGVFPSQS